MADNTPLSDSDIATIISALNKGASIGDVCNVTDEQIESLYALAYNLYTSGNFADAGTVFQALCLYRHKEVRFWMGLAGCRQAQGDLKGAVDAYAMPEPPVCWPIPLPSCLPPNATFSSATGKTPWAPSRACSRWEMKTIPRTRTATRRPARCLPCSMQASKSWSISTPSAPIIRSLPPAA